MLASLSAVPKKCQSLISLQQPHMHLRLELSYSIIQCFAWRQRLRLCLRCRLALPLPMSARAGSAKATGTGRAPMEQEEKARSVPSYRHTGRLQIAHMASVSESMPLSTEEEVETVQKFGQ